MRRAAPEVADGVAELVVPLGPQGWEFAYLVAADAYVPGLRDQFDLLEDRVLGDDGQEGGELVHVVEGAGQRGGQVEAEAVHSHLGDPVAQGVGDELEDVRLA